MTQPVSQPPYAQAASCYAHPDRPAFVLCQRCNRPICGPCMTQAPVGYQCPGCVRAGNQGMRRVRGYVGLDRRFGDSATTVVLIGLNVAVWLALLVTGWSRSPLLPLLAMHRTSFCSIATGTPLTTAERCAAVGGQWYPGVFDGGWYQFVTSTFTHVAFWHIGFNMLALWMLGPALERVLGRLRYLAVYLGSALVGSLFVALLSDPSALSLGASGAIFGLMGALLLVAIKQGGDVRGMLTWIGLNAVMTFMGSGISWQAHLGGFLGGLAIASLLLYGPQALRR